MNILIDSAFALITIGVPAVLYFLGTRAEDGSKTKRNLKVALIAALPVSIIAQWVKVIAFDRGTELYAIMFTVVIAAIFAVTVIRARRTA
ncbi:hypothetical protein ACFVAJ_18765 [Agromyces sp. NPDC057679]|uniref:hypothetical protein n=1 Tax=Agromyces sp. NPDC057679 TaxID=3346207 RepID=UPI00366E14AA